jgi:predicted nucleic acid-binding protein
VKRVVVIDTCAIINFMHIDSFRLLGALGYSALTTVFVQLEFDGGHEKSRTYFYSLIQNGKVSHIPLEVEDLITMANLPRSKRASDAELSCFVVAQRIGCRTMTDDEKAIKYARNHLGFDLEDILRLVDVLFESYEAYLLGDDDLRSMQQILEKNKFKILIDLVAEAARRRLMSSSGAYSGN